MEIVLQALTIGSNYTASWVRDKKLIATFKMLAALFNALAIICVGHFIASIPVLFTIIRNIVCMNKDKFKNNKPIWICVLGYIIIGIITLGNIDTIMDIVPTIVSLLASLIIWYCNPVGIKVGLGITDNIWTVYYLYSGLYISAINIIIQTIIAIISIIRIKLGDKIIDKQQSDN